MMRTWRSCHRLVDERCGETWRSMPRESRETQGTHATQGTRNASDCKIVDARLGAVWPSPNDETKGTGALDVRARIDSEVTIAPGQSGVVNARFTIDADKHEAVLMPDRHVESRRRSRWHASSAQSAATRE